MPDETMYRAEKSPIVASAREDVILDSKVSFKEGGLIMPRLSLVLSVKNYHELCGIHNIDGVKEDFLLFLALEFNTGKVRLRAFMNAFDEIAEERRMRDDN
jgi:hypothetical protein